MFNLTDILEFIIDRFYYRSFAPHYFIAHGHQAILHVVSDTGNQMNGAWRPAGDEWSGRFVEIFTKFLNKTKNVATFIEVNPRIST